MYYEEGDRMDNDVQFCTECGFKMDKSFGFCPNCGAKIPQYKQEPFVNTPPVNQGNQNYGMNYTKNDAFQQPANAPIYPPPYNQNRTAQYTPPKKGLNPMVIIVIAVIGVLVLAVGGYFGYKALQGKRGTSTSSGTSSQGEQKSKPTDNQGEQKSKPADSSTKSTSESSAKKDNQIPEVIKDPSVYLPKPLMKYTFETRYQDGTYGKSDVVIGTIPKFSKITSVELIEQSEPFTQHFVDGPEGIYTFSDEDINKKSSLWLPFNAKAGQEWDDEGVKHKVVQLGATYDFGYKKFDNCIVVEIDYSEAGSVYVGYMAPGMGVVQVKDKASGNVMSKLLSAAPLSAQEANEIIQKFSPNAMKAIK